MTAFACPHCGKSVALPEGGQVGQRFRCPHCRHGIVLEQRRPQKSEQKSEPRSESQAGDPKPKVQNPPPDRNQANFFESLSPLGAAGAMHGLAAHSAKAAKRRRTSRLLIPASFVAAILIVGVLFSWDRFANRASQLPSVPSPLSTQKLSPAAGNSTLARKPQSIGDGAASSGAAAPHPIGLLLAPAGVRMAVHLRPAELWNAVRAGGSDHSAGGDELRRSLPALASWAEGQMAERCLFPPGEIEEVLFSLVLRSPGDPPDVAATVWLKETETPAKIAARFGGAKREQAALPTWVKDGRALVVRDGKTFAVGPQAAAEEMVDANQQPNPTDESIEELLKQTDRQCALTLVFRPDDLDRFRESLFSPAFQQLAHRVAAWLDPDSTEGAVLSLRLADPFRVRLALRNRPATPVRRLEADVRQRLDHLPSGILPDVQHLDPRTMGRRKLVGRVPAMWKAVALGTQSTTRTRLALFESVLPERAAPNLSLGTWLALTEPPSTGAGSGMGRGPIARSEQSKTVAQRLAAKVDVDFRRTPLSDAFTSIGEDIGVRFEIDGNALKLAGYTKNMPQNFRLAQVPATEALAAILKAYPKMVLVIDEPRQMVIVTTREKAAAKGQKPLETGK